MCILHALSPLVLRGLHAGYGWDETVYISQIDPHIPATYFDAPRARGLTLLTAPGALLSGSIAAMRVWLAIVSGVGMFLAFLPWLRLRRGYIVPVAAALFSTLWVSIYYSFEAMPNQYVGYGALAATGWLIAGLRESGRRRDLLYAATAVAFTALMRPSDALFLVVPMLVVVATSRVLSWRRRGVVLGLLAAGYVAGIAEWIIEAYVRFGGPAARFAAASAENTGGIHWTLGAEFRALAGPILCRNGCVASSPVTAQLWWFALVPLVILGLFVARRSGQLLMFGLATAAALSLALQYFVFVAYPAPRFLEPTYLLLALPVAEALAYLAALAAPAARPLAVTAIVVLLAVAEVPQLSALHSQTTGANKQWADYSDIATYLRRQGVTQPCYLGGKQQTDVAFAAACHDIIGGGGELAKVLAGTNDSVAIVSNVRISKPLVGGGRSQLAGTPVRVQHYWVVIVRPSAGAKRAQSRTARCNCRAASVTLPLIDG